MLKHQRDLPAKELSSPEPQSVADNSEPSSWVRALFIGAAKLIVVGLSAIIFSLDWVGADGWWMTWVAMAGFVSVVSTSKPRVAALYGFVMGVVGLGISFSWAEKMLAYVMNQEGTVPALVFAMLIVWESSIFVIVGYSLAKVRNHNQVFYRLLVPICLWIALEAFLPRVFRWTLGHSQLGALTLVQSVDLGGASIVTFMVFAVASLPILSWDCFRSDSQRRRDSARSGLVVCGLIILSNVGYGWVRNSVVSQETERPLEIGVVQEDPSLREAIPNMRERSLAMHDVDLLIWPESTLGVHSADLESFSDPDRVFELSKAPMINPEPLVGLPAWVILGGRSFYGDRDLESPVYQTAFLVEPSGKIVDRYHKRSLMPLGEYVPGEKTYPGLHDWFQLGEYFEPGTSDAPLTISGGHKVGVIICYEDTMSEVTRKTVNAGAELLVCIINDSAFESPTALRQHLKLARLRAIENRRYLVRAAGTGVSCVIDPVGAIEKSLEAEKTGAFQSQVYLRSDKTLFQWLGNWPPILAIAVLIGAMWSSRSKSTLQDTSPVNN